VLTDFAADIRAETPTAAAAIILNDYLEFEQRAQGSTQALQYWMEHHLQQMDIQLRHVRQRLQVFRPSRILEEREQYVDDLTNRLSTSVLRNYRDTCKRVQDAFHRLNTGATLSQISERNSKSLHLYDKIQTLFLNKLELLKNRTNEAQERLNSASLPETLARGYSITMNEQGQVIRSSQQLKSGAQIVSRFSDGSVHSTVQ
jgi:exodeoxyribonuclease VII large subunit